ncbi:hypothetical protein H3H54_12660 [Brachybacterium sp. Z12]|nr:hypothetical protein H3H54_12660 [Brachybacterium sp. Z12]
MKLAPAALIGGTVAIGAQANAETSPNRVTALRGGAQNSTEAMPPTLFSPEQMRRRGWLHM